MKKYLQYGLVALTVVLGIGVVTLSLRDQKGYVPTLKITGDVETLLQITSLDQYEKSKFTYKDKSREGVSLSQVVTGMLDQNSSLYYVGNDGLVAKVDGTTVEKAYLLFTAENGWEIISTEHPVSSNIKEIKEIIVVSNEVESKNAFTIFTDNANLFSATIGQMLVSDYRHVQEFQGESVDKGNSVSIFTSHKMISLSSLVKDSENKTGQAVIFLEDGSIHMGTADGMLELGDTQVKYHLGDTIHENVVGIYLGETLGFVGDAYYDMDHYLSAGEKVLTIFLDGFSMETYEIAKERGIIPNISGGEVKKVFSVHTSVTNAGFASMITGTTPDINGVHSREERELLVPSIFQRALDLELSTSFLEGDIQILNTEIAPKLHLHGDTAIIQSAKDDIANNVDFCFLHLHELDNLGHMYGPKGDALFEYLQKMDQEIGALVADFDGKVFLVTDHGMHKEGTAGNHGSMRYEDMVTPMIYLK